MHYSSERSIHRIIKIYFFNQAVTSRAADTVLKLNPWLNESTSCSLPEPWVTKQPSHPNSDYIAFKWNISEKLKHYTGVYSHKGFGNITIYDENDESLFLLFGRFGKMRLQPISDKLFSGYYVDKLWFITGSDDHDEPIRMQFTTDEQSSDVTGVLFPVDFGGPLTLFTKNLHYDWLSSNHICVQEINSATHFSSPVFCTLLTVIILNVCLIKYIQ